MWPWIRPLGGLCILAVLLCWLGTGPIVDALRTIGGRALVATLVIGALTTVCCAWRWSLFAGGLGVRLPLLTAVADCYRSVFLNATLPGGVVGDVHRAVRHGREVGDLGRAVRAVVWERTAGQVVQLAMAMIVLSALPSPVQPYMSALTIAVLIGGACAVLVSRALSRSGLPGRELLRGELRRSGPPRGELRRYGLPRYGLRRLARALRTARAEIRAVLLARRIWLRIVLASMVAVAGHLATFLIAARAAGATAPLSQLVPLTLLALLAMGLPANIGGFGPREGAAAWAFGAAGLTATQGVATAVVYGALVLVASLPGAAVLVVRRVRVPGTPDLRVGCRL
jgi:uncharacterized protein (TIRG00374 family)